MSFLLITPQIFIPPGSVVISNVSESFEWFRGGASPPANGSIDGHETLDFAPGVNQDIEWSLMPIQSSENSSMIVDLHYRMSGIDPGNVKFRITPLVDGVALAPVDAVFAPGDAAWKTQSIVVLTDLQYQQNSGLEFTVARLGADIQDTSLATFHLQQTRARY